MDNEKGLQILDNIFESFKESGIEVFLHAGTLLGLYRDKKLIDHDTDIDIGILHHDAFTVNIIKEKMINLGFKLHREFYYNNLLTEQSYLGVDLSGSIKVDVFYFNADAEYSYHFTYVNKYPGTYDIMNAFLCMYDRIEKLIEYNIDSHIYYIPENTETILKNGYGESWKTPTKEWIYYRAPNVSYIGEGISLANEDTIKQEDISFVIPYRETEERKHLFDFVLKRIELMFPKSERIISVLDNEIEFNRGMALNNGAFKATRKYLVLTDADVIFDRYTIFNSIKLLKDNTWVVPFDAYAEITKEDTERIMGFKPDENIDSHFPIMANMQRHKPLGGMTVIRRKDFIDIGGFDERLIGWGFDDNIFAHKADILH
jgi:hypothetical protein